MEISGKMLKGYRGIFESLDYPVIVVCRFGKLRWRGVKFFALGDKSRSEVRVMELRLARREQGLLSSRMGGTSFCESTAKTMRSIEAFIS